MDGARLKKASLCNSVIVLPQTPQGVVRSMIFF